jgi:hypothetical protein
MDLLRMMKMIVKAARAGGVSPWDISGLNNYILIKGGVVTLKGPTPSIETLRRLAKDAGLELEIGLVESED